MVDSGDTSGLAQLLGLAPDIKASEGGQESSGSDGHVPELDARVGGRVRHERRRAGLEASAVAAAVGLTPDKLSKIETGKRRVSPRELPALARALNVPMATLVGTVDSGRLTLALAHRIAVGAGLDATSNTRARAAAILEAEDRLSRHAVLPVKTLSPAGAAVAQLARTDYAAAPRTKPEAQRQGKSLAQEVRRHLELGTTEIGDLPGLIEMHFAVDVALSPLGEGSDGLCAHAGPAALLVVNTDFPFGRTRFTLAHELGHHLLNDVREVIEEGQKEMWNSTYVERRVSAFAAHLLLPVKAVAEALSWLDATGDDILQATPRGQSVLGYLMVRYGVSMQCALGQLADVGALTLAQSDALGARLNASDIVRAASHLIADRPGPEETLREQRPPARLVVAAVDAARVGAVGMNTVAVLLGRPDSEELFAEVMYGSAVPALV
jgi:Zn-dependent peptidase ImmA (M78 family)/transcriptional regulator with XRE-family HTH domain